jgi:hypothetical protein
MSPARFHCATVLGDATFGAVVICKPPHLVVSAVHINLEWSQHGSALSLTSTSSSSAHLNLHPASTLDSPLSMI